MTDPNRCLKVFLCHASQDKLVVHELSQRLSAVGWIDPWVYEKKLLPGQDWRFSIEEAVETADIVIICLSTRSVSKDGHVQKELRYSQEIALEKPEGTLFLVPIRLDECEVPRGLRLYHWADYFGERQEETYQALLQSLKLRLDQKLIKAKNVAPKVKKIVRGVATKKAAPPKVEIDVLKNIPPKTVEEQVFPTPAPIKTPLPLKTKILIAVIVAVTIIVGLLSLLFINYWVPSSWPGGIVDDKGVKMHLIPAGTFTMGSDVGETDEKPAHTVRLDAFYMDVYEVTNALYWACEQAGGCTKPHDIKSYTHPSYYVTSQYDNYPVIYVDWNQAKAYCAWRSARLPTEAEWEYAARGSDQRTYPWGEGIDETFANYNQTVGDTTAVGSYEKGKSQFGLYDMAGNVWEWVSSLYKAYPYKADDGRENLSASGARVLRGGAWDNNDNDVRSASRSRYDPANAYDLLGFRCARDAK